MPRNAPWSQVSLATDMVFADGHSTQLGAVTGSAGSGMTVSLDVGVEEPPPPSPRRRRCGRQR